MTETLIRMTDALNLVKLRINGSALELPQSASLYVVTESKILMNNAMTEIESAQTDAQITALFKMDGFAQVMGRQPAIAVETQI